MAVSRPITEAGLKKIFKETIKEETKHFATKDDFKNFATKDDLKHFATKDDFKNFATKDDLKNFATKDDVKEIVQDVVSEAVDQLSMEIKQGNEYINQSFERHTNHFLSEIALSERVARVEQHVGLKRN